MAHFEPPVSANNPTSWPSYYQRDTNPTAAPNSVWRVDIAVGGTQSIALWGADRASLRSTQTSIVQSSTITETRVDGKRVLKLQGGREGLSVLTAVDGGSVIARLVMQVGQPSDWTDDLINMVVEAAIRMPVAAGNLASVNSTSNSVYTVVFHNDAAMQIVTAGTTSLKSLKSAVESASCGNKTLRLAISGSFANAGPTGFWNNLTGDVAEMAVYTHQGDPKDYQGDYAYLAYIGGSERYTVGMGKIPLATGATSSAVIAGLGGLISLIQGGVLTGTTNPWFQNHDRVTGRCIFGHNPLTRQAAVIVQDYANPSYNLKQLRNVADAIGCTSAVGLDGSTSAFLYLDRIWKISPNWYKNSYNRDAVAFCF